MADSKYKRIQALFTDEQLARLGRYAEAKGVGVTTVIRWCVDSYAPLFLPTNPLECIIPSSEELQDVPQEVAA